MNSGERNLQKIEELSAKISLEVICVCTNEYSIIHGSSSSKLSDEIKFSSFGKNVD